MYNKNIYAFFLMIMLMGVSGCAMVWSLFHFERRIKGGKNGKAEVSFDTR